MATHIKNMDQARALKIAREVMTDFDHHGRTEKAPAVEWQTKFSGRVCCDL